MKKIVLLSIALVPMFSFASDNCQSYFEAIDSYLTNIADVPSMKPQFTTVQNQYEQSKKQIMSLPETQRDAVCTQGLSALKMAEKRMQQVNK